jgi:DNA mismatch endonuclease (patch repair protein)
MDPLTPEQRSRQMARVRAVDTGPELIVRKTIFRLGYRYRLHSSKLPGRPDLVFPRLKKVVFVHGCFWHQHSCPNGQRRPKSKKRFWTRKLDDNIRRDRRQKLALRRLGWEVLVIWECETRPRRITRLAGAIQQFLNKRPKKD